jgi:hypothetical protein
MEQGTLVKLTQPADEREAQARYVVVEDRGDRILIEYVCNMPIRPTELVAASDVETA